MMRFVVLCCHFGAAKSVFVIHDVLQMNSHLQSFKLRLFFVYFNHFLIMVLTQKAYFFDCALQAV